MADLINPRQAPMPRAFLGWDGTDFFVARVDATGHLDINVLASALPAGAATAANQATMITALQLIDDLRAALTSVGTDALDVNVLSSALPAGAATSAHQLSMITSLHLIDDLRAALDSVGTDELDVNVEASVLPTGAATAGNQALILARLQVIDNLVGALVSVDTDQVITKGQDQLFSYKGKLQIAVSGNIADVNGYLQTGIVPANEIWVVTTALATDQSKAVTKIDMYQGTAATFYLFQSETRAFAAFEWLVWSGHTYLETNDLVRVYFTGANAGDLCRIILTGYRMTKE